MYAKKIILATAIAAQFMGCRGFEDGYVFTGSLGFRENAPLVSEGFAVCSAVILDYENKAVFAHALPSGVRSPQGGPINADNVVEYLCLEVSKHGIKPEDTRAFIDAGSQEDIEIIKRGLERRGIKIEEAIVDPATCFNLKTISYDPVSNKMSAYRSSDIGEGK